ncbi:MFS transporter, DHA2 family, multidrug resistance protein [Bradyrhizobium shewense]|uniref:MFS transporter, DHA2 family, multidrug resistance protein n=1 Tax=Bradyrhizobium shewense TaxID=1761772 RepID=A0A1C3X5U3_9BRAD|nr:MFS transporter [Bradyrhizobium shewense]SCB47565.1 MFS transporter, DHA2 family, multidrug resistance protein [Bradyrhizobium shewense]
MTATVATAPRGGALFVAGIVLATLTEAIASTVLSLGRGYIIGDVHVTPDEFAWLDVGYIALKLIGFMTAPLLVHRVDSRRLIIGSTLVMGAACGLTIVTARLDLLIVLRMIQGLAGGILLVAGQVTLFHAYPRSRQPILQAVFAMGSVVAPATLAPALQGWLIDSRSWAWIFFSVVPLALAAAGLLLIADDPKPITRQRRPLDWVGLGLISVALICFSYVLNQGSRWAWFEEPGILWLTVSGTAALLAFLGRQVLARGEGLLDFSLFECEDFCFAFVVSFVAGAALFGSAFLIPSFAVSVLAFRPTDAGLLLLPSGAFFVATLLVAAFLMQVRRVPPVATVPFGILMITVAMWMLSGSTSESGAHDMMAAILLRGLGLGFLFLSITLIAFGNLNERNRAFGIGLFNTSRQLGGLIGVAGLETLIEHHTAGNLTVLGANLTAGVPAVSERLTSTAAMLAARGMDALAGRAATSLLDRVLIGQSTVVAFDTAFNAVALLFVFAVPVLVTVKLGLHRYAQMRAAQSRRTGESQSTGIAISVECTSACIGSNCSTATAIALAQRQIRSGKPSPCPGSARRMIGANIAETTKQEIGISRTDLPEGRALALAAPERATSL